MKKMSGGPNSVIIKVALFVVALSIIAATLVYTNYLVDNLQKSERRMVELFAKSLQHIADPNNTSPDISFLVDNIVAPINIPIILTNAKDSVNLKTMADFKNIDLNKNLPENELRVICSKMIADMDATNKPILVTYVMDKDTIVLQKVHYGNTKLISELKYYPMVQMAIIAAFVIIGYVGFSQIKKSEQRNIWVGMSKETAHQYGTPLSSLMGWAELLKSHYNVPDKVLDTAEEMSSDIEKLNKITTRFSKIGSKPDLKSENLYDSLYSTVEYFKRRLPLRSKKKVSILLEGDRDLRALLSVDLFEWVIENLIKNALDAIEHDNGVITIAFKEVKNSVEIEVSDNGNGIELKRRKDIFRPGYSTKRRGWGLGLSLSRRIIEDYHKGKIAVKTSSINVGTTFRIAVQKA